MKTQRTIALLLTIGAVGAGSAGPADAVTKRKAPKAAVTCSIAKLDSATARHTAQYNPKEIGIDGITATDDWETVSARCNNENITGKFSASTTLKLVGGKGGANKTSGKVTGKVAFNHSFGEYQSGSQTLVPKNGTYSCADKICTINTNLVKPGKPNAIIAILIGVVDTQQKTVGLTFEKIFI